MPTHVQERWTYKVKNAMRCIALSRDGRFVFAGSKDGYLYCFEQSGAGELLWQGNAGSEVCCLALAEGCERIVVGCTNGKAYLWNYDGHLLRTIGFSESTGAIQCLAVTPTAHRIALSSIGVGTLSLFDATGTRLWQQNLKHSITSLVLTSDGRTIVLGTDNSHIYLHHDSDQEYHTIAARFW